MTVKRKILIGSLLAIVASIYLFFPRQEETSTAKSNTTTASQELIVPELHTEVIDYVQSSIPKKKETGHCWTWSIATPSNSKAWRCMSGNYIHDPCFEVNNKQVVCEPDPENKESGTTLNMTEDLPTREPRPRPEETHNWRYKLSNNLICEALTGTAGTIGGLDGDLYYYVCDKNIVMVGHLDEVVNKTTPLWQATVVYLGDQHEGEIKRESLSVLKAWR